MSSSPSHRCGHAAAAALIAWCFTAGVSCGAPASATGSDLAADGKGAEVQAQPHTSVEVADTSQAEAEATSTPDLGPPNRPPAATDDLAKVASGGSLEISVLHNDSDPDGDALKIVKVSQGQHGVVAILYAGTAVEYSAIDDTYAGLDSFTYTVVDGNGGTDTGTVTVNLKGKPTLKIVSPLADAVSPGPSVQVVFKVTGCTFTHPGNDKNGCHAHRALDGTSYAPPGSTGVGQYVDAPINVTPLTAGAHVFTLQLVKNDGSDAPWSPAVADSVSFQVK